MGYPKYSSGVERFCKSLKKVKPIAASGQHGNHKVLRILISELNPPMCGSINELAQGGAKGSVPIKFASHLTLARLCPPPDCDCPLCEEKVHKEPIRRPCKQKHPKCEQKVDAKPSRQQCENKQNAEPHCEQKLYVEPVRPQCEPKEKAKPSRPRCEQMKKAKPSRQQCKKKEKAKPSRPQCEQKEIENPSCPQCEQKETAKPSCPQCDQKEIAKPSCPQCEQKETAKPSRQQCEQKEKAKPQCEKKQKRCAKPLVEKCKKTNESSQGRFESSKLGLKIGFLAGSILAFWYIGGLGPTWDTWNLKECLVNMYYSCRNIEFVYINKCCKFDEETEEKEPLCENPMGSWNRKVIALYMGSVHLYDSIKRWFYEEINSGSETCSTEVVYREKKTKDRDSSKDGTTQEKAEVCKKKECVGPIFNALDPINIKCNTTPDYWCQLYRAKHTAGDEACRSPD